MAAFDIEDLLSLARVTAVAPHPAEGWSVAVCERRDAERARYVSDLWRVPHDGGAPTRLTGMGADHKDRSPRWWGETLLFLSDRKVGKEDEAKAQVWALPPRGEPYRVTAEPLGVMDFRVAGETLVVLTEKKEGVAWEELEAHERDRKKHGPSVLHYQAMPVRFWDHWLGPTVPTFVVFGMRRSGRVEVEVESRRELTPDAGEALRECDWDLAQDGGALVCTWAVDGVDRIPDKPLAVIDVATGDRELVGVGPGVVHASPRFGPGRALAAARYTRRRDRYGDRRLWVYAAGGGEGVEVTAGWDRWPTPCGWLGEQVLCLVEERGRVGLFAIDPLSGARERLGPETLSGEAFAWEQVEVGADGVIGITSGLLRPPELVRLDMERGELRPLGPLSGLTETASLTVSEHDVEVAPGREVHTLIVEPEVVGPGTRTILWIHGGPVAAWGHRWHWRWCARLMASQGLRVVLPNPAGSTGYGGAWVDDIWGNTWGGRCYEDLMGVVEYLENRDIRARDMVVMGGSFGGYMTNWIGAQTDRFGLLVTHASLFSLSGFHGVTDMPSWWELMMGASPWDVPGDGPGYDRYSPARDLSRWKTPTLILHGEKDYRVPIGEGLALFEALQRSGVESELVVFPDENHWILKPRNIAAWYRTVLDFIARHPSTT